MSSDKTIRNWQKVIIADAEKKLGRQLQSHEHQFITSRCGFSALEMIHDTVKTARQDELETDLGPELKDGSS